MATQENSASGPQAGGHPRVSIASTVNGEQRHAVVAPMRRLLDVLREDWGLTGAKEGCGEGECGACTVLLDGQPVNSCLVPAVHADGAEIRTIEGLADHGALHAVQAAFLAHGGAQCGICTPGMAVTAAWLVDANAGKPVPEAAIRQCLAGNLCRCTGYGQIVQAVVDALGAPSTPNPKFVAGSGTDAVWGTEKDPAVVAKAREQEPVVTRIELTALGTSTADSDNASGGGQP